MPINVTDKKLDHLLHKLKMLMINYIYTITILATTIFNFLYVTTTDAQISVDKSCALSPGSPLTTTCTPVKQWTDFANAIVIAKTLALNTTLPSIIFCPFNLKPSVSSTVEITTPISIQCQQERKCILDSSAAGGSTLVRIRGPQAQVRFQGFIFQGSGKIFSAIHIVYGVGQTQSFCNCIFQRNIGPTRGTAIRAEPLTKIYIKGAIFQDNVASDMGVIFNRGSMVVENSLFQRNNGTGAAIATSSTAQTQLKGNIFSGNKLGFPLFFQGPDFINSGGNFASNNYQCDGIYVLGTRSCTKFPSIASMRQTQTPVKILKKTMTPAIVNPINTKTLSPSEMPLYESSTLQHATCELINTRNQPCISVRSWSDFRNKVEASTSYDGSTLIFCPFTITRDSTPVVYITASVEIACAVPRQCRLISSTRHLIINGFLGAQVYIQGFVFEGAKETSILFRKYDYENEDPLVHTLCNIEFIRNQGTIRGSALSIEVGNSVIISECNFKENKSTNIGGAIYNMGTLTLIGNTFFNNSGTGSALASKSEAVVRMAANNIVSNSGRNPIFLDGRSFTDLGGNNATGNIECDGVYYTEKSRCVPFSQQQVNISSVVLHKKHVIVTGDLLSSNIPRSGTTPRGGQGYFNYDPNDYEYGPGMREKTDQRGGFHYVHNAWKNVVGNEEYIRWKELSPTHNRSLENKCSLDSGQSPIDLCENYINAECVEHHQTRTHSGNVTFGNPVMAQILPSMLRLKYYKDRTPNGGPYPPEADFAADWHGYAEVNNIDVKIPSEHTICGKRFPAEYSIFMLHPKRRQTIVMSILLDFDASDSDNKHFQVALDQWQATFDRSANKCRKKRHLESKKDRPMLVHENQNSHNHKPSQFPETPWEYMKRLINKSNDRFNQSAAIATNESSMNPSKVHQSSHYNMYHDDVIDQFSERERRVVTDNSPFGTGGWDPFHPSLMKSIYHWGYWGSLTEPPCSSFFAIRVLSEPAYISRQQWNQMRNLLFNYKDENCVNTSVDYGGSVARPIQDLSSRPLYKCTRTNYVSDAEKEQIRIDTGNPKWCC